MFPRRGTKLVNHYLEYDNTTNIVQCKTPHAHAAVAISNYSQLSLSLR